jgi:hypothetical protein
MEVVGQQHPGIDPERAGSAGTNDDFMQAQANARRR